MFTTQNVDFEHFIEYDDVTVNILILEMGILTCIFVIWPCIWRSKKILVLNIYKMLSRSDCLDVCCLDALVYNQILCTNKILQQKWKTENFPIIRILKKMKFIEACHCNYITLKANYLESINKSSIRCSFSLKKIVNLSFSIICSFRKSFQRPWINWAENLSISE